MNKKNILLKIPYDYRIICENIGQTKILVKKEDFQKTIEYFVSCEYREEKNKVEYMYIYGMMPPVCVTDAEGNKIVIQESLDCFSLTNGIVIPLDLAIQERAWNNVLKKDELNYIDEYLKVLMIITDCVFRKRVFSEQDKKNLGVNKSIIEKSEFIDMLKKVFFGYTEVLIDEIMNDEYETIVSKYLKYANY